MFVDCKCSVSNIVFEKDLQERDWGSASGMLHKDVDFENLPLDSEDIKVFKNRIIKIFEKYYAQNKNSKVLVITHSGVIRTILESFFSGVSLRIPNVSLTVFKFSIDGNHKLILEPCNKHLN